MLSAEAPKDFFGPHSDNFSNLVYFENNEATLDVKNIMDLLRLDPVWQLLQHIYVLHGQRHLLVLVKKNVDPKEIEASILKLLSEKYSGLERVRVPMTNCRVEPVVLRAELTEGQLRTFGEDVQAAVGQIEAKTGLHVNQNNKKVSMFHSKTFR